MKNETNNLKNQHTRKMKKKSLSILQKNLNFKIYSNSYKIKYLRWTEKNIIYGTMQINLFQYKI